MSTPKPLEIELMDLRRGVRLFAASLNADPKVWFGGSGSLQAVTSLAIMKEVLMGIRRHTDPGRKRPGQLVEPGLESLYAALVLAGQGVEAERLRKLPQVEHLRHYVDKRIAHAKPGDLGRPSPWYPTVRTSTFQYIWLSEAVNEMSAAYLRFLNPNLATLDPQVCFVDPFEDAIRETGLPGMDWPPGDVFRT